MGWGLNSSSSGVPDLPQVIRIVNKEGKRSTLFGFVLYCVVCCFACNRFQVAELETLSNPICTGPTTVYTTDDIAEGMLCAR